MYSDTESPAAPAPVGEDARRVDALYHTLMRWSPFERDELMSLLVHGAKTRETTRAVGGYAEAPSDQARTKALPSRGLTLDTVERCFTYQAWDSGQVRQAEPVREAILALARAILRHSPDCPDRSSGLRKLRELRMDINSAITHRGEF